MKNKGLVFTLLVLLVSSSSWAGVMMQGFYWDVPSGGNWYNTMEYQADGLRYMAGGYGINRMWFPPASKAQSGGYSMGYDPADYYDLGEFYQHGTTETRFGSASELRAAVSKYSSLGIAPMVDIVLNHRSGGGSEYNPKTGGNTWTDFGGQASGKCLWHWDAFHPNNYCGGDPGSFGGFPDVCYRSGPAYNDMKTWLGWMKNDVGFWGGFRFDYVKGLETWVPKDMRSAHDVFGIGEYWDANTATLDWWANAADNSVFDFALYYTLSGICNNTGGGGYLPNVFDHGKSFAAKNPHRAVTFVANHDTDEIYHDKMMAYAFILTYQGYPCIAWRDYFDYGLATSSGKWGNGIKQLVWCREKLAGGSPNINILKSDDGDVIIYESFGVSASSPGYIVVINDSSWQWKGGWVQSQNVGMRSKNLKAYAWHSGNSSQNYQPDSQWCQSSGWVQVWAPPRGYAVFAPDGL